MSTIIGIDPSLNSTGIAVRLVNGDLYASCISPGKRRGMERLSYIRSVFVELLEQYEPSLVVFEEYALGFRGASNAIFSLGEIGGILRLLIFDMGIAIITVPPTSLKLFATGKGNSDKTKVGLALKSETGVSFSSSDQNDASWLLLMGEAYCNPRSLPRDRRHHKRRGMAACRVLV